MQSIIAKEAGFSQILPSAKHRYETKYFSRTLPLGGDIFTFVLVYWKSQKNYSVRVVMYICSPDSILRFGSYLFGCACFFSFERIEFNE